MIRIASFGPVVQLKTARTVLGRPLYVACAYYVDGLLIDTGPAAVADELRRVLADLEVTTVVNTHAHEDHVGNDALLAERGIIPYAHPLAVPVIAAPSRLELYRRAVWGSPAPAVATPVPPEVATGHYRFRIVHTPGHSPDHICLFEERQGWLFSGDLFLSPYVKVLRVDENPHQIIASLKQVLALPVTTVFDGGGRVVEDGRVALQRKLDFWERLRDQARDLRARGRSPVEIRRALLGREGAFKVVTWGHFSKQNLIDALLEDEAGPARP